MRTGTSMRATTKRSSAPRWQSTANEIEGAFMRRVFAVVACGALVAAAALSIAAARIQGQPPGAKSVRLRTLGPGDDLYILLGGGGNTLAMLREDGAVLIDTKLPGWGQAIAEAIDAATDRPVTTIINTHAHADH